MKLLTKEILKRLPLLYTHDGKPPEEVKVVVKFFSPVGAATWYATEYDPETRIFYGYADLGNRDFAELGYFSLDELESIKLSGGLGIERDIHFGYDHTLAEVMNNRI